ncbi:filamentous haemagglutinin family protein [Bradyrhizobium cenepequi]|uniref:filamentous haemagglutinin family protein n=1 Tax=Bradyrhizobium cenepequi TaxID=2821403 RepID=UPI001CE2C9DB|nr:filamentous haemagglutinin family protein [Bradyrhizobium cenepequi]MCA6108467.1 filamentous hemagglutinin family protein [Bradyrhizobium cenepequi]
MTGAEARPLGGSSPSAAAAAAAQAASQDAARAAQQAGDALKRASQAIQAIQAAQSAARNLASQTQSAIPNGLVPGGLVVAPGAGTSSGVWTGAQLPAQAQVNGRTQVDIKQTQQKAILNWTTFNVGKETTVNFDQQGNSSWTALNRVVDPSARPSQIAGQIRADGQVYIINRNGIIFGGASQVNVGALIAATANITDDQFLDRGIYSQQLSGAYLPSFTGAAGSVTVEAGAELTTRSPKSVKEGGRFVMLLGSNVENAGSISTPKGQALLAAGNDFILRPGYGTDANQFSTTRGSEIAPVISSSGTSGSVTNAGLIFSQQGDITLAGRVIAQDGTLVSTTSVNTRGTIHLLNSAADRNGSIVFGGASVTTILPELDSDETALNRQRDALIAASMTQDRIRAQANFGQFDNLAKLADQQDQSRIEIVTGGNVLFKNGSTTMAQGGQVTVSAGQRIVTETGATIDVSGVRSVLLPMSVNNIKVNVQGNELRDAPVNRDSGNLMNANVWIDVRDLVLVPAGTGGYASDRYYTPGGLLEVSGYLNNTAHTIGEWTALGGTITLSGPEVVAQPGSIFNISGGAVTYQGGYIRTTNFRGADGGIYNIGNARADVLLDGVAGGFTRKHERWNVTETWTNPLDKGAVSVRWEDGYTVGRDAGSLNLSTPTSVFAGTIVADVIQGQRQVEARPDGVTDGYKFSQNTAPLAGTLALGQYTALGRTGVYNTDVVFIDLTTVSPPADRTNTAWFDAQHLSQQGLGAIDFATGGKITVDAPLSVADGGSVTLTAPIVDIKADITARSGEITATNHFTLGTPVGGTMTQVLTSGGVSTITVSQGAKLDTRGLWANAINDPADESKRAFIDGGDVHLVSSGDVIVATGSMIDVSSGGLISHKDDFTGGRGGNVTLRADAVPIGVAPGVGRLTLDGDISGLGAAGGGTLTLGSGASVVLGGEVLATNGVLSAGETAPVDLKALEEFRVRAGEILPADYIRTFTVAPPGQPIGAAPHITTPMILAADWTPPPSLSTVTSYYMVVQGRGNVYVGAQNQPIIPAGSVITFISGTEVFPLDYVVPANVFPSGIPIVPTTVIVSAGNPSPVDVVFAAGTIIRAGAVMGRSVAVAPLQYLKQNLLQSGFSKYDIRGNTGLLVAPGMQLDVTMPVYRLSSAGFSAPTGADPSAAMEVWTPPLYLDDRSAGSFTQRGGADLSLTSAQGMVLAAGSAIRVDDGHSVTLNALWQTTIEGAVTAAGGTITIGSDLGSADYQQTGFPGESIWIGDHAVLDVAARPLSGVDMKGHRYGIVRDGGSIKIGIASLTPDSKGMLPATQSLVVIRPGAVLDASGTHAAIDLLVGAGAIAGWQPIDAASNGGSILIASQNGLYIDGTMRAVPGGAGAAGGTLTLALETPYYNPWTATGPRIFTITQDRARSPLPSDLRPRANDASLVDGRAYVSASQVAEGGFDNLALWSRDVFRFEGNVSLSTRQSLALYRGALSVAPSTLDARVSLSAPYVLLDGATVVDIPPGLAYPGLLGWQPSDTNRGVLTVTADLIDMRNRVFSGVSGIYQTGIEPAPIINHMIDAPGFDSIELVSRGDVRFGSGVFASGGDITIEAAQLYPTTGAATTIAAGMTKNFQSIVRNAEGTLTIRGNGTNPALPQSVFGALGFIATTIDQGGIVRAPLGSVVLGNVASVCPGCFALAPDNEFTPQPPMTVTLRSGSITSTTAAGLIVPYGGTTDGLSYKYNGADVVFADLGSLSPAGEQAVGVTVKGNRIVADPGSLLDLSGGSELTGAAFVSGRGGSVDVRETPLVNANPANTYSKTSNRVYALLPSYVSSYAPLAPDNGAGDPLVGQQITLQRPAGGLPAGTYTLLPSTYALHPGAYRIEIGGSSTAMFGAVALGNGSYVTSGTLGIANTGFRSALMRQIILTPANSVRTYSRYSETSYSDFAIANAATFGLARPRLPIDGQVVKLDLGAATGEILSFEGTALFDPAKGGRAGILAVDGTGSIELKAVGAAATPGMASIDTEDLSRFNGGTLLIGGEYIYYSGAGQTDSNGARTFFAANTNNVYVRAGAVLKAGQILLLAKNTIQIQDGAVLDTTRGSTDVLDSRDGYIFGNSVNGNSATAGAILSVANGWLNFLPPVTSTAGTVTIEDGAALRTLGTIVVSSSLGLNLGANVALNARYLTLSLPEINVGTDASLAAANAAGALGSGWLLTQSTLDRLLAPADPALARVERLTLTVGSSLNFIGDVTLDARSRDGGNTMMVLNTPAIYGWGTQGDVVTLAVDTLIWNGVTSGLGTSASPFVSLSPGAVRPGGPGTGHGTLAIDAREIMFGYDPYTRNQNEIALDRLALGFATVNLTASDRITAKDRGTLSVYHTGTNAQTYAGGELNITTPLLTAEAGGFMSYTAGGAITARAPGGGAINTAAVNALGGELHFNGSAINIDTAIALPSGRLELNATGDVTLTERSRIDLSGRAVTFFDVTKYSWGGDLAMASADGAITQHAGSVIDVSAVRNQAGSVEAIALGANGTLVLNGTLRGSSTGDFRSGGFDGRARSFADFAGLNATLNDGGFFGSRTFVIKTGDLAIGDDVRANEVNISVDGGSLTVNGRIDASGKTVGIIRLAARDDLVLAPTAVLDAHGTVLQVDGYGKPIEASNRGHVELTSAQGTVRLASGATIDLRSADAVARGQIEINAQRRGGANGTGAGANDIAVEAAGPLNIWGAGSIAVNGFHRYELADGIVNQSLLDAIHGDSTAFIDAAWANGALLNRLSGLRAYGDAFHLRPGIELTATGDITVVGDLDLAGYRYGPNADPARRGSGEPGVVVMRAGGNLKINGSINDGFAPPPVTPDDGRFPGETLTFIGGQPIAEEVVFTAPFYEPYGMNVFIFPVTAPGANDPVVVSGMISDDYATYGPGDTIFGGELYGTIRIAAGTVVTVDGDPSQATISYTSTRQGKMWAVAPMLAPGSLSWSTRYVAGADLGAADTRAIQTQRTAGNIVLKDPHGTGIDGGQEASSVLRTGTGNIELLAAGDYRQESLFGVYTAGTAVGGLARETRSDGTVLGPDYAAYEAALNPIGVYFTEHGGDVLLAARGDIRGRIVMNQFSWNDGVLSSDIENWSWSQQGSWGINFGTYAVGTETLVMRGFAGIGALGGGNVILRAGGDAGESSIGDVTVMSTTALSAAIGSSGRIGASGAVVRSGGGTLTVDIAGRLNPGMNLNLEERLYGDLTNLRGNIDVRAGAVGTALAALHGVPESGYPLPRSGDPRPIDPLASYKSVMYGRVTFNVGDGAVTADSRTDLVTDAYAVRDLWTDTTGATLFSAGGDISPGGLNVFLQPVVPSLSVTAAHGNILLSGPMDLLPSPIGQLEFLASNSINGRGDKYAWIPGYVGMQVGTPFGNLHIDDPEPIRFYAVAGDIANVQVGQSELAGPGQITYHVAGKQAWLRAGRDIFNTSGVILNNRDTDVSIVSAGRDIIFAHFEIAGPGTLLVSAGRNVYQADYGSLTSIGPLVPGDLRPGAGIVVQGGVGAAEPDYSALVARYLNPANLAQNGIPLADQPGKVAKVYTAELAAWLSEYYGFAGIADEAPAFFATLAAEQQNIFLRQVYFAELREGGREYNDQSSSRYGSYLRGRQMIATLFPETDENGKPIQQAGDIVMFDGSGVRTNFGGDIQLIAPGGQVIIGVEGKAPPATAGVMTQGSGDIQIYAKESILLGLSRIMTTFGGDILAWSAEGDINAGRGAKTTVLYTPPRRVYDKYGSVALSPVAPSSGAGIATLSPIPEVPPGDIDLIAPLGTIDAGEAGIRVSGNVNLAALQIINAGNIQVQGSATGIPTVQAPNVSGALAASNTAGAASQQAKTPQQGPADAQPSIIMVEFLGFGGGGGSNREEQRRPQDEERRSQIQDPKSRYQIVGAGNLTEEQFRELADERRKRIGR